MGRWAFYIYFKNQKQKHQNAEHPQKTHTFWPKEPSSFGFPHSSFPLFSFFSVLFLLLWVQRKMESKERSNRKRKERRRKETSKSNDFIQPVKPTSTGKDQEEVSWQGSGRQVLNPFEEYSSSPSSSSFFFLLSFFFSNGRQSDCIDSL